MSPVHGSPEADLPLGTLAFKPGRRPQTGSGVTVLLLSGALNKHIASQTRTCAEISIPTFELLVYLFYGLQFR